jgi:putative peptide zinc metalloprotease protein
MGRQRRMSSTLPKLRGDLTVSAQTTASGRFYVIKDPVTGRFFRLREAEGYITQQLDGETPLDAIRARVQERFGAQLAPETLNEFARQLRATGLLDDPESEAARSGRKRGRWRGSLLYLRYKVLDPTRLFDFLLPWVGPFFTPYFLLVSAAAILLAVDLIVVHGGDLIASFMRMMDPVYVPLYIFVAFSTVALHEFAHGLTCRRYGGEVREIGLLMIYFSPALYCNVSDAWLFPEKSKRLWVAFAGPYFELFLWAMAVILWRATEVDTLLHYVAVAVIGVSGIKTLFNFSPLIKLDGYYILSDFLEVPNLQKKSFAHVGKLFKRLVGKKVQEDESETPRERRIYLTYGLIAAGGTFLLLSSLLLLALSRLADGSNVPAAVIIPALIGLGIRGRLWAGRVFAKGSGARPRKTDYDEDDDFTAVAPAAGAAGAGEAQTPAPNNWAARARRLVIASVLLLLVVLGARQPLPLRITGAFNILAAETTEVRSVLEGIIERVHVTEGQSVRRGQVMAVLSDRELRASLLQSEAQIREAEARLRLLRAGPLPQEVSVIEASIARAETRLRFARRKLERFEKMLEGGLVARSVYEEAEQEAESAEGDLREAEARRVALLHSIRPEQVEEVEALIDRLDAERRRIVQQLASLQIVSSAQGVVGTPARQLLLMHGQLIRKGDSVLKVHDLSTVKAQVLVSEKEIPEVRVGYPIELRVRAFPDHVFRGKVTYIASSATAPTPPAGSTAAVAPMDIGKAINAVIVHTEIENGELLLKPEMTGRARIYCGERSAFALLLWHLKRYFRMDTFVW